MARLDTNSMPRGRSLSLSLNSTSTLKSGCWSGLMGRVRLYELISSVGFLDWPYVRCTELRDLPIESTYSEGVDVIGRYSVGKPSSGSTESKEPDWTSSCSAGLARQTLMQTVKLTAAEKITMSVGSNEYKRNRMDKKMRYQRKDDKSEAFRRKDTRLIDEREFVLPTRNSDRYRALTGPKSRCFKKLKISSRCDNTRITTRASTCHSASEIFLVSRHVHDGRFDTFDTA